MLATTLHGPERAGQAPLLIVHGLYGSARNWGVIAKNLSATRQVLTVDMRNHGESAWCDSHTYADMAGDLAEVIAAHGGRADVLGHSMGGKAAMALALSQPDLVDRLIVADIAPVRYSHSQIKYIEAMQALDLSTVTSRMEADRALRAAVPDLGTRAFLLQSLNVPDKVWRLNLKILAQDMPEIMGFPTFETAFGNPTLFLSGGASDYVLPEHRPVIKALFPKATLVKIPGTGHWLHAEKPREVEAAVNAFLT